MTVFSLLVLLISLSSVTSFTITCRSYDRGVASVQMSSSDAAADVTFLVPKEDRFSRFGGSSPLSEAPLVSDAVSQLANKVGWFADGKISCQVTSDLENTSRLLDTDVLIAMGFDNSKDLDRIRAVFETRQKGDQRDRQCHFALDCANIVEPMVGPYSESNALSELATSITPWVKLGTAKRMQERMQIAFDRWTSDDFCYAIVLFVNEFSGTQLDWVKYTTEATWEKGPIQNGKEFLSMVSSCSDCVQACVADEQCRTCLQALTEIDPRDQVTNYRTIVSYESDLLRDFSLCILSKNNVFGCEASIPKLPVVPVLPTWRDQPLTTETASQILIGHLDDPAAPSQSLKMDTSWKVACGANVAYDQFPSQNQIFYPANSKNLWYDPVFRVETLDGRHVWCTRHYRVRPQSVPGTFRFSVLDNGVTSDEFWTIVGVADDLSWVVFHYAGAASAVGQQYLGGLVCTPDGTMPSDEKTLNEIWESLRNAGIEPWELCVVDNSEDTPGALAAGPPPLDTYRKSVVSDLVES